MTPWNSHDDRLEPQSTGRYRYLVALVAAAILSAIIFPMSWQLLLVYICVGGVIGFLSTLDELPRLLALVILAVVSGMGPAWMAAIAPQWHSTRWEPGMVLLGAMAAVHLRGLVRRPLR